MDTMNGETMDLSKKHSKHHKKSSKHHPHHAAHHPQSKHDAHHRVHHQVHDKYPHTTPKVEESGEEDFPRHPDSSLRVLVTLSRHGSRRPNEISSTLCPNNKKNLDLYNVPPEQLTEIGMEQMLLAGEEIRREYIEEKGFLSDSISGPEREHFETYFRSDSADRCAQSAIALGYGLYPDGTGPTGFIQQPISVIQQLLKNEHDFAAPKGPCKAVAKADVHQYFNTRAKELIEVHKPMLEKVGELCGINIWDIPNLPNGEDIVTGIKDIADTFTFDKQQGLEPLKGLTPELQSEIEALSFQNLMERYYSTDREITYWVGGFPHVLNKNLQVPLPNQTETSFKYYSYHGHRELLHGMGKLLGWDFDFENQPRAMNTSALEPGTTLFFELHEVNATHFVRTYVWSPVTTRTPVKLGKCSDIDCPLNEFTSIFNNHIEKTGTWQEICNFTPSTFAPVVQPTTTPLETTITPVQTTSDPLETTKKPVETTSEPVQPTKAVKTTTLTPVETTTAPVVTTTVQPELTTEKPEEITKTPEDTTKKPKETTEQPKETTEQPKETTEQPKETTEKPVETTKTPKETTSKPELTTTKAPATTEATESPSPRTTKHIEPVEPTETTKPVQQEPTYVVPETTLPSLMESKTALRLANMDQVDQPPMTLFEGAGWFSYLAVVAVLVYFATKRYNRRQLYRRLD